jgi:uncharacterized OsmC-like protein
MDADRLRALQAPLKQRYRDDANTARIIARAEAVLDANDVACTVPGWAGPTKAGLHPAAGGDGSMACSADMLLEALVACAGTTVKAVATAMGITLRSGRVLAEGVWDARGTLGVDPTAPIGLTEVVLRFELDTDAEPAKVEKLVHTAERYCVILQTLKAPPAISVAVAQPGA